MQIELKFFSCALLEDTNITKCTYFCFKHFLLQTTHVVKNLSSRKTFNESLKQLLFCKNATVTLSMQLTRQRQGRASYFFFFCVLRTWLLLFALSLLFSISFGFSHQDIDIIFHFMLAYMSSDILIDLFMSVDMSTNIIFSCDGLFANTLAMNAYKMAVRIS